MTNKLPVSRVVSVSVNLAPPAAQAQSLSNLLILGVGTVLDTVERFRSYATIDVVAADFGTGAAEYLAALAWFAQTPQPTELSIGRWYQAAASGGLRCAPLTAAQQALANFTAINNGSFLVGKDGNAAVAANGMNFTGATTLPGIAAIIQAACPAGVTCTWNSIYGRFEFTSTATGANSAVSFLAPTGAGTDISALIAGRAGAGGYTYPGAAAETAASAVATFDDLIGQEFYGLSVLGVAPDGGAGTASLLAVAAYIEAAGNKHFFGITSQEAGALVAVTTTDIGSQLKALGYKRTIYQYSSTNAYAILSALARLLTVDYEESGSAITLKFKQEPGVAAENLTTTQANTLRDKRYNVFAAFNNDTSILQEGMVASGDFADTITGTDWLALTIQRDLYNALYTSRTKIPQTDEGMAVLKGVVEARCAQAVVNGLLAPGVWNSNGFGLLDTGDYLPKGYYIYSAPVSLQSTADRAARMAQPIQVAAKLAGAIHSSSVTIAVNN